MSRNQDPEKRALLLRTAVQVFGAKGYSATTIKDIAGSAGLAAGTVYNYFRDKDDLFQSCFQESWTEFHIGMEEILSRGQSIQSNIEELIHFGFDLLLDVYPLVRGMYTQANLMDMLSPQIERLCTALESYLGEYIVLRIKAIQDDTELKHFFMQMMISGILSTVSQTANENIHAVLEDMKRNLLKGLQFAAQATEICNDLHRGLEEV
ncbi:TetR/AcrR family transcriptional regulator [Spirochaeta dissipatitropha]